MMLHHVRGRGVLSGVYAGVIMIVTHLLLGFLAAPVC